MPVKILSSPFVTFLFPLPDGLIDSADRAQLAVGYPLAAAAPVPEVVPEVVSEILRVPSLIPTPQTYYDALVGEIPELYLWIREIVIGEPFTALAALRATVVDSLIGREELLVALPLLTLSIRDCLKAVEAPAARVALTASVEDKLKFSAYRKRLIDAYDEILGVK